MKKTFVRIAAVAVLVVMLACSLVACGGLSGTYATDETLGSGVSYTFKGKEVTIEVKVLGFTTELVGEYSIDDDKITFTFDEDEEDASKYEGSFDFEKGDDYIKIGGIKYEKED